MSGRSSRGRVRRTLTHPLFVIGVVTIATALAIWFAGPLVAFGEVRPLGDAATRLALLLVLAVIAGVLAATIGWRRAGADERLLDTLRREEAETAALAERDRSEVDRRLALVRRKTDETLARLGRDGTRGLGRFRRFGPFRRRAFRLPWYLVIGPAGAGKTALLLQADLGLPFGAPTGVGGPTDDVDYVFAENAVYLDVSGRLAGAGAEPAADHQLWLRLLDLVRRLRRYQPACGIVLVLDAAAFADMDEEARRELAKTLRRRLDEAGELFRARPPVYLVFSKLDRLLGFSAFFETTDRTERDAVFGLPFAADEEEREFAPADRFRAGFAALAAQVARWRLPRLQEEPDARRRALVYEFPDQFAALGEPISAFVHILAVPHRFDRPPFLRGIFFASALQDGAAIDLLGLQAGGAFAGAAGLARAGEPASARPRPFFLRSLLTTLAPADAAGSGLSATARRITRSWQTGLGSLLLLLSLGLALHWINQHRAAAAYASALEDEAEAIETRLTETRFGPRLPPFVEVLPVLDALRAMERREPGEASASLASVPELQDGAERAYAAGLDRLFAPYLAEGLKATLASDTASAADLFQGLKLSLALTGERPLASLDLDSLGLWLARLWLPAYSEADRASFISHLAALGRLSASPRPVDPALVTAARERIAAYTLAQLALDLAKAQPAVARLGAWRPSDHAGSSGGLVIARLGGTSLWDGLPGFFTRAAFRDTSLPSIRAGAAEIERDAWVLGEAAGSPAASDILQGTLALYSAEFIRQWDGLLSELSVRPLASAAEGARALSAAVTQPSPVAELFAAIAAETDLSPPPAEAATGALAAAAPLLGLASSADPGRAVTEAFEALRRASTAAEGGSSQVSGVLAAFEPLYRGLNHVAQGGNVLELQPSPVAASAEIDRLVEALPPASQPFFRRLQTAAMELLQGASGERLREVWNTTAGPACQAATADRFPFVARAQDDTPYDDLKAVFGPDGAIASFRETYLKPLIDTSVRPWTWRPGRADELGLEVAALAAFEQADAITQAFFPGGEGPAVRFTLQPLGLDPQAKAARFDVGGQTLRYAHGPAVPTNAQWPPATPNAPAALTMTPEIDGAQAMLIGEGPWALFRLLNQAVSRRLVAGNALQANFSLSGRAFAVKLTPASTRNPFELKLMENFRCPSLG